MFCIFQGISNKHYCCKNYEKYTEIDYNREQQTNSNNRAIRFTIVESLRSSVSSVSATLTNDQLRIPWIGPVQNWDINESSCIF
mmetsp:Transcript_2203/g.3009  ORF Transcript_2203/g.3009 Transcript_2203/m.3009 type:complete len:84 (+) Transcript_2203:504-755(+)